MDNEGLNQGIIVHSLCTKKSAVGWKAQFFRDLAMCTRRPNRVYGFGQSNQMGDLINVGPFGVWVLQRLCSSRLVESKLRRNRPLRNYN
jgi:hypothetical protein